MIADGMTLRLARADDIAALTTLIRESASVLSAGYYSPEETAAAIRFVFGVDSTLIADGTYLVVEQDGEIVGCGGWSRRRTLYGGDQRPVGGSDLLNPAAEAARVRAFFVAPAYARRGIGRRLLSECVSAAAGAGFTQLELMATLPGVPLYASAGFTGVEDVVDVLPDGTRLRFVRMVRKI